MKEIVSRETGSVSGLPEVFRGVPGNTGNLYIVEIVSGGIK